MTFSGRNLFKVGIAAGASLAIRLIMRVQAAPADARRVHMVKPSDLEERKELARKMQGIWWDFVGDVRLGTYVSPVARRTSLTGLIGMSQIVPMWNMQKASV